MFHAKSACDLALVTRETCLWGLTNLHLPPTHLKPDRLHWDFSLLALHSFLSGACLIPVTGLSCWINSKQYKHSMLNTLTQGSNLSLSRRKGARAVTTGLHLPLVVSSKTGPVPCKASQQHCASQQQSGTGHSSVLNYCSLPQPGIPKPCLQLPGIWLLPHWQAHQTPLSRCQLQALL